MAGKESPQAGSPAELIRVAMDCAMNGLSQVLREAGLSRGINPTETQDVKDFARRIGMGRNRRDAVREHLIREHIGIPNGRSRVCTGAEFLDAMKFLAPDQHSERR